MTQADAVVEQRHIDFAASIAKAMIGHGAQSITIHAVKSAAEIIALRERTSQPIPLQGGVDVRADRKQFPVLGSQGAKVDWQFVADHGGQAQKNHYQTVARLAERGGLSWSELYAVVHNREFQKVDTNVAMMAVRTLEARYLAALRPAPGADEIIERCAKVADDLCARLCTPAEGPWAMGGQDMCRHVATEIRKLKGGA